MYIVVGLGNPGTEYADTRHNVGWFLLDAVAESLGINDWRNMAEGVVASGMVGSEKILLAKPLTYMNNSGICVGEIMRFYKLPSSSLVVCHDDLDLPVGSVRIRKKGSSGGHNGIKSIIEHIGSEEFSRVRIGIGRPAVGATVINHVLSKFLPDELAKINDAVSYLAPAVQSIVADGIEMAMNRYNKSK